MRTARRWRCDAAARRDDGRAAERGRRAALPACEAARLRRRRGDPEARRGRPARRRCDARRPTRGSPFRASCSASTRDLGGVADGDPAVAAAAVEDVERALDWASELGSDALLVPFFGRAELRDEADVERAAAALRPLCRRAAERGVVAALRGHAGIRRRSARLAAAVDSPAFGCYFDTANVVTRAMDTATELRGLGDLVQRVHLKDVHVEGRRLPARARAASTSPRRRARSTRSATRAGSCWRRRRARPSSSAATSPSRARSCRGSTGRRRGRASASSRARPPTGTR